jgi:predicted nucleic acid-binding Zn ribbon protein
MPTYQFRCPDGTIIERVFKISEAPESIPVPDGSGVAVRIISGGADLIFKGSGFYITDYGKDGKKDQREKSESRKPDAAATSGESAAPAAPAAASPAKESTPSPASPPPGKSGPSSPGTAA